MYISELIISNFKSFKDEDSALKFGTPNGNLGSGLNIFVGENNTGKSTIFEAIDFLRNGTKKDVGDIKNKHTKNDAKVQIKFSGDIEEVIDGFGQANKIDVFKKYIYIDSSGVKSFKICRDTADLKQIKLWDDVSATYKNESGIDAPLKKLFEANFVWADTNPSDEASFGASTICGSLLKEVVSEFAATENYKQFTQKFNEVFNSDESELRKRLRDIELKVQNVFSEQFGSAQISFRFDELKIESFFKNSLIEINDGTKTALHEKGNGMQRAVILSLLQVYAEQLIQHPIDVNLTKPFFLFIDEPEICLHPRGQEKLFNALLQISRTKQIFIATHSPYFLTSKHLKGMAIHVFRREGEAPIIETPSDSAIFPWSPTWGEINFRAYNLPTVDFHNELYGHLQSLTKMHNEKDFDNWLASNGILKDKKWTREGKGTVLNSYEVCLSTFIRNKIHHPENLAMSHVNYSRNELALSISQMIQLISKCHL